MESSDQFVQGLAVSGLTIPRPHETILSLYKYSLVWLKWVTILWLVTHHPKVGGCSSVTQMNPYMMKELTKQSSLWSNLRPHPPGQKTFLHSCKKTKKCQNEFLKILKFFIKTWNKSKNLWWNSLNWQFEEAKHKWIWKVDLRDLYFWIWIWEICISEFKRFLNIYL